MFPTPVSPNSNSFMDQINAHYNGNIPGMYPPAYPGIPPVSSMSMSQEQIEALIDKHLSVKLPQMLSQQNQVVAPDMTRIIAIVGQVEELIQRALPAEDYKAFAEYIQAGGKGSDALIKSEALYPIVQLLWETIKENTK